jgi:SAM-dependent methyltransferase
LTVPEETRSVIFGRDAGTYDEARPGYPPAAIEHITALTHATSALEVGAGTGKATAEFARADLELTCLEPSPQMAEILDARGLPGVDVVVTSFEDWDGMTDSVDLIYAAQAWHWVDKEVGFAKALSILRPRGVLALLWNIPVDRYGPHRQLYARHAPELLAEKDERINRRDDHDWCADMEEAGFVTTERFTHRWSEELTADRYRALYSTYSDHMMLDESTRTAILDGLVDDAESRGGTMLVDYRTEVFSGRKPDTGQR